MCGEGAATSDVGGQGWLRKAASVIFSDAGGCVSATIWEGVQLAFFATNPATAPVAGAAAAAMCPFGAVASSTAAGAFAMM